MCRSEVVRDAFTRTGVSVSASSPEAFGRFLGQEADKLQALVDQGVQIHPD